MKIVFVSFIDSTNIGDLLIAEVLEDKLMKGHQVKKYSYNLIPERDIVNSDFIIKKEDFIKSFVKKIYSEFFRKIDFIDRLHLIKMKKKVDNNKYISEFENDVKESDLLIIGGGNAIFDLTKHSLSGYKLNKILEIAKKYNKKSFVTSIGIGPFITQKQIDYTVNTLKKADFITVRDKKSFDYLKGTLIDKAFLSVDPVFLLNEMTKENGNTSGGNKVISVCVIDLLLNKDNTDKYNKYINNYIKLINKLNQDNYKINLFSTEPRDYRAVYDVFEGLDDKNNTLIVPIKNMDDLMTLYSKTDLIIGTRMHSMIIGLSQLIPVIGLSWQDKVNEMFEIINLTDDVIDIEEFGENISKIINLVEVKLKSQSNLQLDKLKKENEEKFKININLIEELRIEIEDSKKGK